MVRVLGGLLELEADTCDRGFAMSEPGAVAPTWTWSFRMSPSVSWTAQSGHFRPSSLAKSAVRRKQSRHATWPSPRVILLVTRVAHSHERVDSPHGAALCGACTSNSSPTNSSRQTSQCDEGSSFSIASDFGVVQESDEALRYLWVYGAMVVISRREQGQPWTPFTFVFRRVASGRHFGRFFGLCNDSASVFQKHSIPLPSDGPLPVARQTLLISKPASSHRQN